MPETLPAGDDLQRLTRALRTLGGSNHALLHLREPQALMQEICRVMVHEAGYAAAAALRYEPHDGRLTPVAHCGSDAAFADLRRLSADEPQARNASRIAAETGEPCLLSAAGANERVGPQWREFFRRHGVGAVFAMPLRVEGQVHGVLAVLAPEDDAFDEPERAPLLEAAADLAFGLEGLAARAREAEHAARIRQLLAYDRLTGLPNRETCRQRLTRALERAGRDRTPVAVLRIAFDRYQEIDEVLGGSVSEGLLLACAQRLQALAGPDAELAHVAEAEFVAVLPGQGAEAGRQAARRLIGGFEPPVEVEGVQLDVQPGVGVAVFPGHGDGADALMRRAGIALAHGRRARVPLTVFSSSMDNRSSRNMTLMSELREALSQGQLRLYCQPKLSLAQRRPCGMEALVRWDHPGRGLIQPAEFIGVAESTGLITCLTYWVLEDVLRAEYAWRVSGLPQQVSVNLSAHDLRDPRFIEKVADKLGTWGPPAGSVEFELTESALMEDPHKALEVLHALKQLDVRLAIDDFGTGYSSLAYLRRLPVDAIKIDQSFVRHLRTDAGAGAIVRSTIDLAHHLDLQVVAEGVEDDQTLRLLGDWGCDAAQGFFVGQPMPAGEFAGWVHAFGARAQ